MSVATIYVASTQGKLVGVDLTGMKLAWSFETEAMKKMLNIHQAGWNAAQRRNLSGRFLRQHGGGGRSGHEYGRDHFVPRDHSAT